MANSLNGTYEAQKRQKEAKIEHKSTGVTNSINKASADAMARADVYSPKSAPVGTDINGRNLIPTQDSYTQAAYEEYLTTGKINPGYTSLVSFDDLEAFGDAHTQKLKDGRSFYSYGTTTILDGYKFDNNALKRSKEMFEDYWDKTGSKSAKWGYDLTDPEDYRRYQEGLPSKKYEEGYGDDAYSLWLKENGLGHADYFMNGSSGYYEQALFEQAELDKQIESTDAFMKEVRRRVKFIADDPFNVTMDEIYRAAEDVRYANPEYRDFSIENPGLAKKTIEDFKDYASPELAYDEYIAGLDKNRGKYGHIYLDTLYTSVTGKPYSSPSSESASSASSSSSSGNKTAKAEEELYKAVADEFLRSGEAPTSENIDKYIAKVIESDTTGKYDDVKFVEEKDYSDSTWGNVSAARDKSKGITLQEAKEGVIRAYGDMTSTEITAPADYDPEARAYKPVEQEVPQSEKKLSPEKATSVLEKLGYVKEKELTDLERAVEMIQGYRADGYSEDVIKEFVTSRGLPYQDAVNAVRYQGLWTREAAKQQASTPADSAPATERTPMRENYDPRAAAEEFLAYKAATEQKLSKEAEKLKEVQSTAKGIIDRAMEAVEGNSAKMPVAAMAVGGYRDATNDETAVDTAVRMLKEEMSITTEEALALIQADQRLDYRDSTDYRAMEQEQAEAVDKIIKGNPSYELFQSAKEESLKTPTIFAENTIDTKKAATQAYRQLREAGLKNGEIERLLAENGLNITEVYGYTEELKDENLDALIDTAREITKKAKEASTPQMPASSMAIGGYRDATIDKDDVAETVDNVLVTLIESRGYTKEQAFSMVEDNGRLSLRDSERYADEIEQYLSGRISSTEAKEIVVQAKNDNMRNVVDDSLDNVDSVAEFLSNEVYSDVLAAVGGDEYLAEWYMNKYGLSSEYVSSVQKEKAVEAENARLNEEARKKKESVEDEWFNEYFRDDEAQSIIKGYNDPTGLYQTLTPKGEEILTSRVSVYRDAMTALGRSQFEIDNALRRNGLGFMISDEESGAHYYEDVLTSIGLDPETAAAVVEMSDSEELREYGEEAKYSPDWENSTLESVENTLIAMGANAALGTLRTIGSIADFLTGHQVEEIDQFLDSIEEKMARFRAAAEDPNHKNAGIVADAGSEVFSIVLTSNTSKFFTKSAGKFGISGLSKVADYFVSSLPYFGRSLGINYREYIKSGAPVSEAKWGATIAAAFEAVTEESIFSGTLLPKFVERAEDAVRASGMSANIKSGILRYGIPGLRLATYAVGESFEEFESSVFETFARKWTWDDHASVDWGEAGDSARMGAVIGLIYGALGAPVGSARYEMSHDILSKFESAIKANSDAMPYIDLDSLAAVSHVETEVSKERYEKFKIEYEAGTIQSVTEAEFKDAIGAVFTSAESSKKESRRYKEKTKSYETEEAVAAKKVESIETQLKGIFASAEARKENGEAPFSVEDAKTVKALFDKLAVAKRDFERVSADVVAKKDTAANDYSSKAQKDKESYMKNRAVVEQYFMQKCFEMDLQLFGKKAEQPAMEAQTAEATGVQPADIEVEQTEQPSQTARAEDVVVAPSEINGGEQSEAYKAVKIEYEGIANGEPVSLNDGADTESYVSGVKAQEKVSPAKPIEPVQDTVEPQVVLPAGDGPVEGIISQDLAKTNNWFKNWFNKIHAWTFAGQRSLERVSAKQKKDGSAVSLASAMTAYRNAGGTVEYILKDALVDRFGKDLGVGSFNDLLASIKNPEKFIEYMMNLHNIDRMSIEARTKPQLDAAMQAMTNFQKVHPELAGVSPADAAKASTKGDSSMAEFARLAQKVEELQAYKNKPVLKGEDGKTAKTADESRKHVKKMEKELPELKQWAKRYNEWMNAFGHAWLVETGLISQELWDTWHREYKNYFPTHRVKYNNKVFVPLQEATGATSALEDFRNVIARQINSYVRSAKKNDVLSNLYSWADANPAAAKYDAKIIDDPSKLKHINSGVDFTDMETDPETLAFWSIEEGRYIVRSKKDGDWVYMAVSEENFKAIEDLFSRKYSDPAEAVMKAGRGLTDLKKGLITVWNPFFALSNLARDVQTAYISDESANPVSLLGSMKTAASEMHNNSERWKWYKSLGSRNSGYFNSRKPYLEQINEKPKGFLRRSADAGLKATSAFGEYTEDLSRFSAFIRYLDKHGDTPQNRLNAANYAAEITTDFSRSGRAGKFVDSFCIYMNANLQGIDKIGRQLFGAESSWKTRGSVLGKTAGMGIASALLRHLFWDLEENEHYQNLPGYVKDAYFCIPNPFDLDENGTSKSFVKIPKAQGYNVFISAFDRFATMWLEDQSIEEAYDGFMDSLVSALPVSPSIALVSNILAVKNNKDWKGSAIEPAYMSYDDKAVTERYDANTSVISIRLSHLLNSMGAELSPMMIDYVIDQNTGVIGDFLLPATAVETFDKYGTEEQKYNASSAAKSALEIIERRFVVDPLYSNGITSKFYEAKDEASDAASEAKREREAAKVDKKSPEEELEAKYKKMSTWLNNSYKEERAILNSEVNSKKRDEKIDEIRRVRNETLKEFMAGPASAEVKKYTAVIK